jgi:hypothetical protein
MAEKRRPTTFDDLGVMFRQLTSGQVTSPKIIHSCGIELVADRFAPGTFYCDSPTHIHTGWILPMAGTAIADPSFYTLEEVADPVMVERLIYDEKLGYHRLIEVPG